MKRLYGTLLGSVACSLLLSACGGGGNTPTSQTSNAQQSESIATDKTQLYVGNYYGGLGDTWLRELKTQYEALHNDVQIVIDNDKANYLPDNLITKIGSLRQNLFFVDNAYYYDLASQNKLADITDVVTAKLTQYNETRSIEDKLNTQLVNFFKNNDVTNGKYYALPTYLSQYGWVYDVDLFESKKLFIADTSTDSRLVWTDGKEGSAAKSKGQDGVSGTQDDGLPSTWSDFTALISRMKQMSITPFIWTGKYIDYTSRLLRSYWAAYEGADNFQLNYTFSGSETLNGDTSATAITDKNAYELQRQKGKKAALQLAKEVFSDSYNYAASSVMTINDHIGAQKEYIYSNPTPKAQPIAMIAEGDWWENEARDNGAFDTMVSKFGSSWAYGTRRFAFMPVPSMDGFPNTGAVLSTSSTGCFFVNANCDATHLALAKDFLQFCHTDSALATFTVDTGVNKPFDYTLSEDQLSKLTYFSKSCYQLYRQKTTHLVYDLNVSKTRINNSAYFLSYWNWTSNVGGQVYDNPFQAFANDTSLSIDSYFDGMYTYQKGNWSRFSL